MDHASLLIDSGVEPPARMRALLMFLAGGQVDLLDPAERRGLHPLVLPLARDGHGRTWGFLRWPTPPGDLPLPIVRQDGHTLELLAQSTDELLHRELATRDAIQGEDPGALLAAANRAEPLYEVGDLAMTGLPLKAYLLMKVGVTHAFFEELVSVHLDRGDEKAALVTADRSCRTPGWGRPHAFRALLLDQLGQREEARDAAVMALTEPIWTLGAAGRSGPPGLDPTRKPLAAERRPSGDFLHAEFAPIARLAGWKDPITSEPYRRLAADPERLPLDRASHLMDAVCIDQGDYDAARPELAALYRAGGLEHVARFVAG